MTDSDPKSSIQINHGYISWEINCDFRFASQDDKALIRWSSFKDKNLFVWEQIQSQGEQIHSQGSIITFFKSGPQFRLRKIEMSGLLLLK